MKIYSIMLCYILVITIVHCTVVVCRAFLKISYRAEEIYPAKIKVYLSIYLTVPSWRRGFLPRRGFLS